MPVKLFFQLVQDEDGYPPVGVESVWANPGASPGEYVLSNVPFFVRDATIDDIVQAREVDGQLWFDRRVSGSQNSLIRITFHDRACWGRVNEHLCALGCLTEYAGQFNLLAVSIPPTVKLSDVQEYLQAEAGAGNVGYEEPILRQ
jgi:hypothetical protein